MFHYIKTLFGSPLGIKGNLPLKKKRKIATQRKEKERLKEKSDKEIETKIERRAPPRSFAIIVSLHSLSDYQNRYW